MQASNRNHEAKPPNVLYVVLASLFGYPGAGHLMVGQKRTGAIFAVTFTATTVAMVVEAIPFLVSLIKQLTAAINDGTAPPLADINFPRLILWTILSLALWVASAVHAGNLAKKQAADTALSGSRSQNPPDSLTPLPEDISALSDSRSHEKSPE